IMAQLGLGGNKDVINLPYSPDYNIYYQKINLMSSSSLILYAKSDPITNEFVLEKSDDIFKNYLNSSEIDLAFRGKERKSSSSRKLVNPLKYSSTIFILLSKASDIF
ncbi:unnamed protein product, partial [marine sediment metagenome]